MYVRNSTRAKNNKPVDSSMIAHRPKVEYIGVLMKIMLVAIKVLIRVIIDRVKAMAYLKTRLDAIYTRT